MEGTGVLLDLTIEEYEYDINRIEKSFEIIE
jgi:hypothetical protein